MAEFDPRRAEPGQEFTYTTDEVSTIGPDEDVPEGAEVIGVEEREKDGETTKVRTIRRSGVQRTLRANDDGVVQPKTAQDEAVLLSFGLTRHGPAVAAQKAADDAKATKADAKKEG